jgi:outer membrane protein assembly factor BamD (BamD/ComL family)
MARSHALAIALVLLALALGLCVFIAAKVDAPLGLLGVAIVLAAAGVGVVMLFASPEGPRGAAPAAPDIERRLDALHDSVKAMAQQATLSDDARRVLNRPQERAMLNSTIEADIAAGNFDAAIVLIDELANRFGYRADAEQFRSRIEQMRRDTIEAEVTGAIASVDALAGEHRWDEAYEQATRVQRLYPSSPRAQRVDERVRQAHDAFKKELERAFLLATQEGDLERSLDLLRRLDAYLTPVEAEPLRELARGVIGKARDNLGDAFKLAVQDKRWGEAASLGDAIIQQFPNTRMAAEVRDVIDGVRARAATI